MRRTADCLASNVAHSLQFLPYPVSQYLLTWKTLHFRNLPIENFLFRYLYHSLITMAYSVWPILTLMIRWSLTNAPRILLLSLNNRSILPPTNLSQIKTRLAIFIAGYIRWHIAWYSTWREKEIMQESCLASQPHWMRPPGWGYTYTSFFHYLRHSMIERICHFPPTSLEWETEEWGSVENSRDTEDR